MPRTAQASRPAQLASDQVAIGGEWRVGCDRCGASYTLGAWLRLPVVAHVEAAWLATHLVGWRADVVIDVRRCARCMPSMSRRRPADGEGGSDGGAKANGG